MENTKMTKAMKLEVIASLIGETKFEDGSTVGEFVAHEVKLLTRKKSGKSKKTAEEQATVMEQIVSVKPQGASATDIMNSVNAEYGTSYTLPKVSAMLKKLVESKQVTREVDGKKVFFSVKGE